MALRTPRKTTGGLPSADALLGALSEAVIGVDAQGAVCFWNAAAARLLGTQADAALGRPLAELLPCPASPRALAEALEAGAEFRLAGSFAPPGGELIYMELVGMPIPAAGGDGSGQACAGYAITARDLSERIEADQEAERLAGEALRLAGQVEAERRRAGELAARVDALSQAARAAAEADRRLAEFLEALPDACFAVDQRWRIISANAAAARYFGRGDLPGADLRGLMAQPQRRATLERLEAAAAARDPAHFEEADPAAGSWYEVSAYPTGAGLAVFYRDASGPVRSEIARRRAYSLLEGIAENTLDMVAAVDTAFCFTFFNQSYAAAFEAGYGAVPAVGMDMLEAIGGVPGERESAEAIFREAMAGQPVRRKIEFGDPRRSRRVLEMRVSPLYDLEGGVIGAGVIASDVTERERMQQALLASSLHYQTMALASFEGILFSEGDYILDLNQQMADMLGSTVEELRGQPVLNFIESSYHEAILDYIEHRRTGVITLRLVRKDGTRITVESRGRLTPYEGRTIRISTVRDVTEQRAALAALKESEERYHTLFNNRHSPMLLVDPESGRIVDANPAASAFYGWSQEDLGQRKISDINMAPGEVVFRTMAQARTGQFTDPLRFRHRLASGEIRDVDVRTGPIRIAGKDYLFSIIMDVTERVRAERALAESEQRFRMALETIPDVVALYGPDLRIRYINPACEGLTRRPPEFFVGRRDDEIWPSEVYECYMPEIMSAFITGEPQIVDADVAVGEEGYRSLTINCIPLVDEGGAVTEVMCVVHDNTTRVQAEEAVRGSERLFRAIARNFPNAGVVVVDDRMRVRACEGALMAQTAATGDEAQGRPLEEVMHGQNLRLLDLYLRRALAGESASVQMEHEGRTILAQFVPLEDETGQIIQAMGTAWDISGQKKVERELRESESRFRASVESLMDGFAILSAVRDGAGHIVDFRYEYMNEAGCQLNFRTREEQVGRRLLELLPQHRESGLFERYVRLVESGVPVVTEDEDYDLLPGGEKRYRRTFEVRAIKLADGFVVAFRDITRRKEVEAQLKRYAGQLERSNRELEQFAFVASHDLQEPLRKIRMFGANLRRRLGDTLSEDSRDALDRMMAAADRMHAMIDGLLGLSRINTRGGTFSPVDLNHEAAEVVSDLEPRILSTGGTVEVGPLPALEADAMQMRQLLQNLIGNALKFHRRGAPPQVLVQSAPGEGDTVVITVEDNGIGFDPQYAQRIFQPFQRLHGRSEYEGTGMGLAICQRIVERHHGKIEAQSQPGQGTKFTITLPLKQEKEGEG